MRRDGGVDDRSEPKRVVILGAGGFAREVADIVRDLDGVEMVGFVDRDSSRKGEPLLDSVILGGIADLSDVAGLHAVAGSGDIAIRNRQLAEMESAGLTPLTLVHPSVVMSPFVSLGPGCIICAGSILTNTITLGPSVVVNLGVTIGHDVRIGTGCVVSPGVHISGEVVIGEECALGTGAVILPRLTLGDRVSVGAGAVVTRDVPSDTTVVGVPARPR